MNSRRFEPLLWIILIASLSGGMFFSHNDPTFLPIWFSLSVLILLFLPGYLTLSAWRGLQKTLEFKIETLTFSMLLSILWQTAFCILTFEAGLSAKHALYLELISMGIAAAWMLVKNQELPLSRIWKEKTGDATSWFIFIALFVLLGVAGLCYMSGGYIEREQTILARKIAENASAYKFSIMYLPEQAHTYLYDPLAFVIALLSNTTHADVIVITDKMWSIDVILAAIFGAVFVATAVRNRIGSLIYLAFFLFSIFRYPFADLINTGLFMPYPNRYGFGPGILILGGLWLLLRFEESKRPLLFLAVIPIFFLTLVIFHAREGLLLLITYLLYSFFIFLAKGRERRDIFLKYGTLLLMIILCIGLFSIYHRLNVSHLSSVTHELRFHLGSEFKEMLANPSLAWAKDHYRKFSLFVGEYELGRFYWSLVGKNSPAIINPLLLFAWLLPVLLFLTKKKWVFLSLAGFTGLLTICRFPILYTGISLLVGTTDLFHCFTFLYVLTLLFFITALTEAGLCLGKGLEWIQERWLKTSPFKKLPGLSVVVAGNIIALGLYEKMQRILEWHFNNSFRLYSVHIFLLIISIIGLALGSLKRRGKAPQEDSSSLFIPKLKNSGLIGCYTVMLLSVPLIWNENAPSPQFDRIFIESLKERKGVNDLYLDYERVVKRSNMLSPFPLGLVRFLRESVPPLQVFLTSFDMATTIPLYCNQYIAHAGTQLSTDQEYYKKWYSLHHAHMVFNKEPISLFWKENLQYLIWHRVDYLLVGPEHREKLGSYFEKVNQTGEVFETVFDDGKFSVIKVNHSLIPPALEKLTTRVAAHEIEF